MSAIDDLLRNCISRINNTDLSDIQWLQASLPVKTGGLGVWLANHSAPSAYLAAVHVTRDLQSFILGGHFMDHTAHEVSALRAWSDLSDAATIPSGSAISRQHEWDKPVAEVQFNRLLQSQTDNAYRARILAVSAPHNGD